MANWRKRYQTIKRSVKNADIKTVMNIYRRLGFSERKGRGDHVVFFHPTYGISSIDSGTQKPAKYAERLIEIIETNDLEANL